jgi:S-adenosylmethionine decarboxylase
MCHGATSFFGRFIGMIFIGCPREIFNHNTLDEILARACLLTGATVLQTSAQFFPIPDYDIKGETIIKILSESSADLHTFPKPEEGEGVTLLIYTCGYSANPEAAIDYLVAVLKPKEAYRTRMIEVTPNDPIWTKIH